MILSKAGLAQLHPQQGLDIPGASLFSLPEKVLQFGTGVLLRGLPDYFIDKANKQHVFNGRIVIVKSTSQGDADAFSRQDNLYTQCVRGIENGSKVEEAVINAAVSRVLSATEDWTSILACAASPDMQVIISNTTEVGIVLHPQEDIHAMPPVSFPGKLLAFLLRRYTELGGTPESGMIIIPTELIPGNGQALRQIVVELARRNGLDEAFMHWLQHANDFCNSLVDRIVPGKLPGDDKAATESRLGYKDHLMIMSEVYRLWAIETSSERTRAILSFSQADKGVVLAPDIDKYRELKLRLLNGSHTFTCALAVQMGFVTVKQAMEDELFADFIRTLMLQEIVPAITSEKVNEEAARSFAADVIDRYQNPFIEHQWLSIALQYTSKMKMRNVPVLQQYYTRTGSVPRCMALGFAAYLLFMQSEKGENGFTGAAGGKTYLLQDDKAAELHALWHSPDSGNFVQRVLQDEELWGSSLDTLPGFALAVQENMDAIRTKGMAQALRQCLNSPVINKQV